MVRKIMGVKGSCRSANRGGVSLFYALSAYSKVASVLPAFILSGRQFSVHRGKFSAKQGKSEFFFGVLWCFLGIFGDKKGRNLNIFFNCGAGVGCRVLLWWRCFIVSTGPEVGRLSMLQDLPEVGSGPLVVCSMPFARFPALLVVHCI